MDDHRIPRAPDYTLAALIMAGINLTWIFIVIWAIYGLLAVLALAALLNHGISRLRASRRA
ncbi:hypothetical protein Q5Y75_25210 [Ruegeria sp. 2205SS24-7]|uniref:hypothetical protein n=1 Tax=Ruegeria discodermiae TaxID=3064389 RepID=UPI002740E5F1|nr:hypothetical protein [Ruegeria sp. 2205SS24-7]MDP5220490.1 hypothetical protein [Ruegeria sp. 2205SS24-7]